MVCVLFLRRKKVSMVHVWTKKGGRGDGDDRSKAYMPLSLGRKGKRSVEDDKSPVAP